MLRRAEEVDLAYHPQSADQGWLVLRVGHEQLRVKEIAKTDFRNLFRWSAVMPQRVATVDRYGCWMYRGRYFWDDHWLGQRQVWELLDQRPPAVIEGNYPKLRIVHSTTSP